MKYFPIIVHVILAFVVVGLAAGLKAEGARGIYQYTTNGLAAGLVVTALVRVLVTGR